MAPVTACVWMRRLDHSMVSVLSRAATPRSRCSFSTARRRLRSSSRYGQGRCSGVALNLAWSGAPARLNAGLYVLLGWVAVAALPRLGGAIGIGGLMLLGLGGVLYTLGTIIYAVKRPDPLPSVFGITRSSTPS
jgi:hemolysin III